MVISGRMEYQCAEGAPGPAAALTPPPPPPPPVLLHHQQQQPPPVQQHPQPKILSRNGNGTVVWTSSPSNEAELQLYRVMQRASLLAYYDTLLEMGGDDVQQLCEAGEEEFLEIMALVGMASKPLHVRRLQKALQEWLNNPAMFRTPLMTGTTSCLAVGPRSCGLPPRSPQAPSPLQQPPPAQVPIPQPPPKDTPPAPQSPILVDAGGCNSPGQSPGSPVQLSPVLVEAQICRLAEAAHHLVNTLLPPQMEPKAQNAKRKMSKDLEQVLSMSEEDPKRMELIRKYAAIYGRFDCKRKPEKPLTLHEVSVNEAAAQICRFVPALLTRRDELFPLARQVVRDSGYHYSKGHSKSYPRGHSGYNGDHPPSKRQRFDNNMSIETEETIRKRQERLDQIAEEIRNVSERTESLLSLSKQNTDMPSIQLQVEALQTRHQQLLLEQSQLVSRSLQPNRLYRRNSSGKLSCVDSERPDTDDTDSQLSYSNTSSPLQEVGDSRDSMGRDCESSEQSPGKQTQNHGDSEDEPDEKEDAGSNIKSEHDSYDESFYQENKVKVIASSGGNIIAVANPALSMSPAISIDTRQALLKKETLPTVDPKVA